MEQDNAPQSSAPAARRCRHRAIADLLREQLALGKLASGMKLPPLRQLASDLDVSVMTVREAIGVLEREGRVHRIPAVGTFVRQAQPAPEPKPRTIALSMEDFGSPFEVAIARGVDEMCQDLGLAVQIFDARSSWQVDAQHLSRLPQSDTLGGIIFPVHHGENNGALFNLKSAGYPFVIVDRAVPGLDLDFVDSDNESGAYLAVQYLVARGHRRILMVTEPPMVSSVAARIRGYERALIDHGVVPRPEWKVWINLTVAHRGFEEGKRNAGGYDAAIYALKPMPRSELPVAVFALNDYIAWGVVDACRDLGLRIPQDVSVICFDDSDMIQALTPAVTVVAQRGREIGRTAVRLLQERLAPGGLALPARHIQIAVDLLERASVAAVPASGR